MRRRVVTRTRFANAEYPSLQIIWQQSPGGEGWRGKCCIWLDGDTCGCQGHELWVSNSMPLGRISASLDDCGPGSWAFAGFDGAGLTERDLQWAAEWAAEGIKFQHHCRDVRDFAPCREPVPDFTEDDDE